MVVGGGESETARGQEKAKGGVKGGENRGKTGEWDVCRNRCVRELNSEREKTTSEVAEEN